MLIYADKKITINEFIIDIKKKFFYDQKNISLEDIWLYYILDEKSNCDNQ